MAATPRFRARLSTMSLVTVDITESVATITLNDPARRNAVTLTMCDEVAATMDEIDHNTSVHSIVVTGAAPAFCAGADLTHLGGGPGPDSVDDLDHADSPNSPGNPDSTEEGLLAIYEGFLRIGRSPLPTIAAVNGAAVGAGMNLALICDVRIAGRSALFDDRFLQIGIHPGGGHTWMLQNICGPQTAAAAVLFGQVLDGPEAERLGLVYRCVEDDQLLGFIQEMAARAGNAPRELVTRTKKTMTEIRRLTSQQAAVDVELGPQADSARTPAFKAKLAALKAKISKRA